MQLIEFQSISILVKKFIELREDLVNIEKKEEVKITSYILIIVNTLQSSGNINKIAKDEIPATCCMKLAVLTIFSST